MKGGRPQAFGRSARSDLRGDLDRGRRKGLSAEAAQLKEHPLKIGSDCCGRKGSVRKGQSLFVHSRPWAFAQSRPIRHCPRSRYPLAATIVAPSRSEEHTSELQSLMRISYAVFCLKKKNKNTKKVYNILSSHYI